jgi:hypothetical protein
MRWTMESTPPVNPRKPATDNPLGTARVTLLPISDELSLCSDEVRQAFKGTCYMTGTPTMMQLSLDVRRLTEAVERLTAALKDRNV